jgi:hypothetical protein
MVLILQVGSKYLKMLYGFFFNCSSGGLRERIGRVELMSLYWSWGLEKTGRVQLLCD